MSKKTADHNSRVGESKITRAAIEGVDIPAHLVVEEDMRPYLELILSCREYSSWNGPDLAKAVSLARTQRDIERLYLEVAEEGDVIKNDRGTPIVNPKHNLLETMVRREVALSRALHVHAEATKGRSREGAKKAQSQQGKLVAIKGADKGLIAGLQ